MKTIALALFIASPLFAAVLGGEYEVPAPQELKSQAVFPIKYDVTSTGIMQRQISYALPEDLTAGSKIVINLKETGITKEGMTTFSDPQAKATCIDNAEAMTCIVKYDFNLITKEVDAFLMKKYAGDINLGKRLNVGRIFSNEPGGVVRYSKK